MSVVDTSRAIHPGRHCPGNGHDNDSHILLDVETAVVSSATVGAFVIHHHDDDDDNNNKNMVQDVELGENLKDHEDSGNDDNNNHKNSITTKLRGLVVCAGDTLWNSVDTMYRTTDQYVTKVSQNVMDTVETVGHNVHGAMHSLATERFLTDRRFGSYLAHYCIGFYGMQLFLCITDVLLDAIKTISRDHGILEEPLIRVVFMIATTLLLGTLNYWTLFGFLKGDYVDEWDFDEEEEEDNQDEEEDDD